MSRFTKAALCCCYGGNFCFKRMDFYKVGSTDFWEDICCSNKGATESDVLILFAFSYQLPG